MIGDKAIEIQNLRSRSSHPFLVTKSVSDSSRSSPFQSALLAHSALIPINADHPTIRFRFTREGFAQATEQGLSHSLTLLMPLLALVKPVRLWADTAWDSLLNGQSTGKDYLSTGHRLV